MAQLGNCDGALFVATGEFRKSDVLGVRKTNVLVGGGPVPVAELLSSTSEDGLWHR